MLSDILKLIIEKGDLFGIAIACFILFFMAVLRKTKPDGPDFIRVIRWLIKLFLTVFILSLFFIVVVKVIDLSKTSGENKVDVGLRPLQLPGDTHSTARFPALADTLLQINLDTYFLFSQPGQLIIYRKISHWLGDSTTDTLKKIDLHYVNGFELLELEGRIIIRYNHNIPADSYQFEKEYFKTTEFDDNISRYAASGYLIAIHYLKVSPWTLGAGTIWLISIILFVIFFRWLITDRDGATGCLGATIVIGVGILLLVHGCGMY